MLAQDLRLVSLVPCGWNSSTVPAFSISATSWPFEQLGAAPRSSTVVMRAFSSASIRRTSPIRSPRSFSTTRSSIRQKILTSMTVALHARAAP